MPEAATRNETEGLDLIFSALADARRRGMVERLADGPLSVKEIAEPFQMALPSAVKHLALLEEAHIVESEKKGRVRTFRLTRRSFDELEAWVAARKRVLNHQFDRLDAYLAANKKGN